MAIKNETLFVLLSLVNLINYIDRGIIPGAYNEFNSFVNDTVDTDRPSLFIGLLQSAFIVGISLSSVVFGNLVHTHSPFKLIGIGLIIWVIAVIISGLAYYANSYILLILSRMLSGVGEASFQCSVPPFIAHHSGQRKGKWTAIFYTAIPVGTALGYTYGAAIATSPLKWGFAFFIEGMLMFPFVVTCFRIAPQYPPLTQGDDAPLLSDDEDSRRKSHDAHHHHKEIPSAWEEAKIVMKNPQFLAASLGYAAYTGSLIGLSTFGSAFLMGLGFFDDETEASTFFGAAISVAGMVGTPIGGILIDRANKRLAEAHHVSVQLVTAFDDESGSDSDDDNSIATNVKTHLEDMELVVSTQLISWMSLLGATVVIMTYFAHAKYAFIVTITIGCLLLFCCTAGMNLAMMLSVPHLHRSFAVGLNTMIVHMLGDVPSPIIAGYLKDELAPGCTGDDDEVAISDECRSEKHGQRLTMLWITLWLIWAVLLFFVAYFLARHRAAKSKVMVAKAPRLADRLSDLMKSRESNGSLSQNLLTSNNSS